MSQPPAGYGYDPGHGAAPVSQRPTDTMAILALVFAFVFPVLGIVFGVIGRRNTVRDGTNGHGLATAGLWVSIVFVALGVLALIAYVVLAVALFSGSTAP